MKKFIRQVFLFSSLTLLLFIGMFDISNKVINRRINYKISDNIDKIIIGHSHPECAYNDLLINGFKNFSSSATCYFYNYYSLIPLINNNKNIKTVFIEFTNNQIDTSMSTWIWGDNYLPFKYQIFGPYINNEGRNLLVKKNPQGLINGYTKMLKENLKIIATSNFSYIYDKGGYFYLNKNMDDETNEKENIFLKKLQNCVSEYNLHYLDMIISFCKSKNLNIILVRSPLHKKYCLSNELLFQKILKTRFKLIEFLDFKDFPLANSEFADLEHLNFHGAIKFSIWFNDLLEKGLLLNNHKQLFINNCIKKQTSVN